MKQLLKVFGLFLALTVPAVAQNNPFNPDFAWCNNQGAIATRNANVWTCLLPGTNGQVLQSGGPGANAAWLTVTGTGTVTSVAGSGGTTGMTLTGGPITGAGTLTLGGTLAAVNGGTGLATFAIGDILFANTTSTLNRLASVAAGSMLRSNGVGAAPSWSTAYVSSNVAGTGIGVSGATGAVTISNSGVLSVSGGTTGLTPSTATTGAVVLGGTLAAANGGTGQTSYTIGDVLVATGATTLSKVSPGTSGQPLRSNGAGVAPSFSTISTNGYANNSVTLPKLTTIGARTILGNGTAATDDVTAINAGQFPATQTNDNASAGNLGEYIESVVPVGSAVALGNSVIGNITSINITPGDWDVSLSVTFNPGASTNTQSVSCSITTSPSTFDYTNGRYAAGFISPSGVNITAAGVPTCQTMPTRWSVTTTTTLYAGVLSGFSASTMNAYGIIRARRMR